MHYNGLELLTEPYRHCKHVITPSGVMAVIYSSSNNDLHVWAGQRLNSLTLIGERELLNSNSKTTRASELAVALVRDYFANSGGFADEQLVAAIVKNHKIVVTHNGLDNLWGLVNLSGSVPSSIGPSDASKEAIEKHLANAIRVAGSLIAQGSV